MPETFLIHSRKRTKRVHIEGRDDTLCKMFANGIPRKNWQQTPIINPETERLCTMCKNLSSLQQFRKELATR